MGAMPESGVFVVRPISDLEFARFRDFIYQQAGIALTPAKKTLVQSRLLKRLYALHLNSYAEYWSYLQSRGGEKERQLVVNLLSTNETYFFREPTHFDWLGRLAGRLADQRSGLRVWSAAGSTGQEAYSIAMTLANVLGRAPWEVVATDINSHVLQVARRGLYSLEEAHRIPPHLHVYLRRGHGEYQGALLVERSLRQRVQFLLYDLRDPALDQLGIFDIVFLRNVLIYFDVATKHQVIDNVSGCLRPGGWLVVGHSETLRGLNEQLEPQQPSIYRKAAVPVAEGLR